MRCKIIFSKKTALSLFYQISDNFCSFLKACLKNHMHESWMKLFHFNLIPALVDIEVSSSLWEKFLGTFDFS